MKRRTGETIQMKRVLARVVAGLIVLLVAGMPIAQSVAQEAQNTLVLPDYRVGIGDKLKIAVYGSEKLGGDYLVGGDGKIAVPILGRVMVSGLTLDAIGQLLAARLSEGYLNNPRVTVDMVSYRPVYILGEVQKPGQYPYVEGMTIYQLVAQAGGFTYRANRKTVKLRREGEADDTKYDVVSGSEIKPGDTLLIMQRYF